MEIKQSSERVIMSIVFGIIENEGIGERVSISEGVLIFLCASLCLVIFTAMYY